MTRKDFFRVLLFAPFAVFYAQADDVVYFREGELLTAEKLNRALRVPLWRRL